MKPGGAQLYARMRAIAVVLATVVLLTVIVMVALPYIVLVRIMEYNVEYPTYRAPRVKISDVYPHLRTGDIILFASTGRMPSSIGAVQRIFSHAGLLLRRGDLVYVSESSPGIELMPGSSREWRLNKGVDLVPLLVRIKYYTGSCYIMRLSRPLDADREAIVLGLGEKLYRERYPYPSMWETVRDVVFGVRAHRHCFRHICYLLDRARLAPLDLGGEPLHEKGVIESAREICELSGRALPDGYSYAAPAQIVYDIDSIPVAGSGSDLDPPP